MRRKAISLREEIIKQLDNDPLGPIGVEPREDTVRGHLNFVYETLLVNPLMDIRRYKVGATPSTTLMG